MFVSKIVVPKGLTVEVGDSDVSYSLDGRLIGAHHLPAQVSVEVDGPEVTVSSGIKRLHGTVNALVNNWIKGVINEGYTKDLEVAGVGYWVKLTGENTMEFKLGYSHRKTYDLPEGVKAKVTGTRKIALTSYDKQLIGSVVHDLEVLRPKSPYRRMGVYLVGKFYPTKKGSKS